MSNIRDAQQDDIEQLLQVAKSLGYEEIEGEFALRNITEILESETDRLWVFEEGGNIVGWLHIFVSLRVASPKFAEIGGLVIRESDRRRGIATKLVNEAVQWAISNQLPIRVRSNSIRADANKFYESIGFEFRKEQRIYEKCS